MSGKMASVPSDKLMERVPPMQLSILGIVNLTP
jgi:hypothetical protein